MLLGSSSLRGTFLAFLLPPAGGVCGEHQGTLPKRPPGMGLSSTAACESLLHLPVLCQGLLEIWALTSRLQAPQDLPCEGLPFTLFSSPLHCSTVSEPYQYEPGDEGGHWGSGDCLANGATFCCQRGGDVLHHLDAIRQKVSVTLLRPVGTAEEKAHLSSIFKVHFSLGSMIWLHWFSDLCLVRIRRETEANMNK